MSPAGQQPRTFIQAEQQYLAALPAKQDRTSFARAQFDQLDKRRLREVMYGEQHSLCVYCERHIDEGYPPPQVEHWRPLSLHPELALRWSNLYLSCLSRETCGSCKGDRALRWSDTDSDLPWPTDLRYEDLVGFTSRGEIYVRGDVVLDDTTRRALELALADRTDGGRKRPSILNLNHAALVAARAAALDSERTRIQRDFEDKTASREDREGRAADLATASPAPPFVSVRVAWLRKLLGRGR